MIAYIIRRLIWTVILLIVISFITFVIFYLLPAADPAVIRAGKQPSPELIASIRETLGLDQPFYVQYWKYMEDLIFHFDFGMSHANDEPVRELMFDRLPATISLAIGAAVVWLIAGITVGIISAVKRASFLDRFSMGGALVAISAPVYWVGLVGLYLFSRDIGLIPIFGDTYVPITTDPIKWFDGLLLPWLVLATAFAAFYARFLRSSLLEVLGEDYIRTARAKGLSDRSVTLKHGVRSAITPIVTIFGLDLGILLGGAILVETVFNIPGIGRLAFSAIETGDLPIIQGTVLLSASAIILLSLAVDIAYAFIDPRVSY